MDELKAQIIKAKLELSMHKNKNTNVVKNLRHALAKSYAKS